MCKVTFLLTLINNFDLKVTLTNLLLQCIDNNREHITSSKVQRGGFLEQGRQQHVLGLSRHLGGGGCRVGW